MWAYRSALAMLVFFLAAAVLVVLFVFDSPAIDYRWVAAGGVLPLVEAVTLRPLVLHTLLGSVLLLGAVMAFTVGQRIKRRRWLGLPIGTFVFLVASGVWTRTELFWWPLAGFDGIGQRPLPEFDRPLTLLIVFEAVATVVLVVLARRLGLFDPVHRRNLWRTGRIPKENLS
jgi:hypothetical protein